jgi:integrase-like protein
MAGKWQGTREPGIYRQDGPTGTRYKYAFRDARGKVTSTTFPRIRDAQALKNSMGDRRAARDLPDVSKSKKTLTDAWDHMVATGRQKPSTLASYRARWITHIDPALGGRLLFSIRRPELEAFYSQVEAKTSLDTRRKVQQIIHTLFAVAVRAEWIGRNPGDGIEMPGPLQGSTRASGSSASSRSRRSWPRSRIDTRRSRGRWLSAVSVPARR